MFLNVSLTLANYILAAIHAIAAIGLMIFAFMRKDRSFDYDLMFRDKKYTIQSVWIVYAAVAFLGITSLVHLFYGLDFNGIYSKGVIRMKQYVRWIEYGVTATIMAIIIALISGVKNIFTLILLGTLIASVMVTGYWFESIHTDKSKWSTMLVPLILGFAMLAVYVFVVFMSYLDGKKEYEAKEVAKGSSKKLPTWITWSVIGTLIFFSSFGIVPLLKLFFNISNMTYEYIYLMLSLLAKLYLGFFLGYGLLQRTE